MNELEEIMRRFLDKSYHWLCKTRQHHSPHNSIWDIRFHWQKERPQLIDALVIKMLSLGLSKILKPHLSLKCMHPKGAGGLKRAVSIVHLKTQQTCFFYKTDVKSYYQSICHQILLNKLTHYVHDKRIINLLTQIISRTEWNKTRGDYIHHRRGLPMGCALSPLLGALYLLPLDRRFHHKDIFYCRYMDDILVLSRRRAPLRRGIKIIRQTLNEYRLNIHPDKTRVGRIHNGFDFLGYYFNGKQLSLACETLKRARLKLLRLFEQDGANNTIEDYLKRFKNWCYAGLNDLSLKIYNPFGGQFNETKMEFKSG